jgi:hypothetical protein
VLRRWHLNSLLTVLLVAVFAAVLPIGSTGPLASLLGTIIGFAWGIIYFLAMVLMAALSLLLYPLRFFLNGQGQERPQLQPSNLQIPTQEQVTSHLPDWLGGALLWTVIVLIAGYFLVNYLTAHGLLRGRLGDLLAALRFWWRARWARLSATALAATAGLRHAFRRIPRVQPGARSHRLLRLSTLAPREKVRYFYLRAIQRAADSGVVRPLHRTPLEFGRDLEDHWPTAEEDVRDLTEAFLVARYDRRDIPDPEVQATQSVWRRVMRALREKVAGK